MLLIRIIANLIKIVKLSRENLPILHENIARNLQS